HSSAGATAQPSPLPLHDPLPILELLQRRREGVARAAARAGENQQDSMPAKILQRKITATVQAWQTEIRRGRAGFPAATPGRSRRSEEHTSEIQSRGQLVCRLLR